MCCGEGIAKTLLVIANLAFVLVGIALLAIGIVGRLNLEDIADAIPSDISTTGTFNFLIAIGVLIFFIAFLGCCGSCKNNVCMINSYGAILIIIFLAQVALGIYAFVQIKNKTDLQSKITNQVLNLVKNYSNHNKTMDSIQTALQCCGATGSSDYLSNSLTIPQSCYKKDTSTVYSKGCATLIYDVLVKNINMLAIVVIAVSAVEVFGAVLAFALANCIKQKERTY